MDAKPRNQARRRSAVKSAKIGVYGLCSLPLLWLLYALLAGKLGVSPVETITSITGQWAIRLLVATIAVSPLLQVTGWRWLASFRKPLGLLALFYTMLHFLNFVGHDHLFRLKTILADSVRTPHILVGFAVFVVLVMLGVTSTMAWVRRLGSRGWRMLHRCVYLAVIGAVGHYFLQAKIVKIDIIVYATLTVALLAYRGVRSVSAAAKRTQAVRGGM